MNTTTPANPTTHDGNIYCPSCKEKLTKIVLVERVIQVQNLEIDKVADGNICYTWGDGETLQDSYETIAYECPYCEQSLDVRPNYNASVDIGWSDAALYMQPEAREDAA